MNLQDLREQWEIRLHETSLDGFHPNYQNMMNDALSVLEEAINFSDGNHISVLGLDPMNLSALAKVFFAALDRTGAKAQDLGYQPTVATLGRRAQRFTPAAELPLTVMTIASETSARVAVVGIRFSDLNPSGYGDWATAEGFVFGIHSCMDDAVGQIASLSKAFQMLNQAMFGTGARPEHTRVRSADNAPSF